MFDCDSLPNSVSSDWPQVIKTQLVVDPSGEVLRNKWYKDGSKESAFVATLENQQDGEYSVDVRISVSGGVIPGVLQELYQCHNNTGKNVREFYNVKQE